MTSQGYEKRMNMIINSSEVSYEGIYQLIKDRIS